MTSDPLKLAYTLRKQLFPSRLYLNAIISAASKCSIAATCKVAAMENLLVADVIAFFCMHLGVAVKSLSAQWIKMCNK